MSKTLSSWVGGGTKSEKVRGWEDFQTVHEHVCLSAALTCSQGSGM